MEEFSFEDFKATALEQLKEGKSVFGKDGVFAPLLEHLLNAALEGEMDAHMGPDERSAGNRRNGYSNKQVQSSVGELSISTPRDRDATFDPVMVKKRERILADSLADRIIGLYAVGTSSREISRLMEEQFGNRISPETISSVTDRVLPELQSWRNRTLDAVYPIVWMDGIHYKVMDDKNRPVSRVIYNVLGLTADGRKDLLGMYIAKSEGSNFWLSMLTDLQNRGVCDILIACVDGLKGFPEVEGYHCQLRKVPKNKGVFPNDTALEKLVYLAYTRICRKWTQPVQNWGGADCSTTGHSLRRQVQIAMITARSLIF